MPDLDLCAAGICRKRRALLFEKGNQAAAAQGRVYFRGSEVRIATVIPGRCEASNPGPVLTHHPGMTEFDCFAVRQVASAGSTVSSGHNAFQRLAFAV